MVKFLQFLFLLAWATTVQAAPLRVRLDFAPPPAGFYAGQEVKFELTLFDAIGLSDFGIVPTDWQNADLYMEKPENKGRVERDGQIYDVTVFRFGLVVKSAGRAHYSPLCLTAKGLVLSARDLPDYVRLDPSGTVAICTPAPSFDVLAVPPHAPPLFPATSVELFEGVFPRSDTVKAGTPLKRSLILTAKGTLDAFLPDISPVTPDGAKSYDGKTERTLSTAGKELVAAVRKTVVIVPERAGRLELPAFDIWWWNTVAEQIEKSTVPPRVLTVVSDRSAALPPSVVQGTEARSFIFFDAKTAAAAGVFLGAVLISAPFLKRRKRRKKLKKAVLDALKNQKFDEAAKAIVDWAASEHPKRKIVDLSAVRALYAERAADFAADIDELQAYLYATGRFGKHVPSARTALTDKLARSFKQAAALSVKPAKTVKKHLPDLYPD